MNGAPPEEDFTPGPDDTIVRPSAPHIAPSPLETKVTFRAYLEVVAGASFGKRFYLSCQEEHIIGRSTEVAIPLVDDQISRLHARVVCANELFVLMDMDSKNGTFLNEMRIHECPLHTGDEITVGNHRLQFLFEPVRTTSV